VSKQKLRVERILDSVQNLGVENGQKIGVGVERAIVNASMATGGIRIVIIEFSQVMTIKKT